MQDMSKLDAKTYKAITGEDKPKPRLMSEEEMQSHFSPNLSVSGHLDANQLRTMAQSLRMNGYTVTKKNKGKRK